MTSCLPEKGHDEGGASSSSTIEELLLSFSELATQYDISAMKGNVYTGAPLPKNEALRLKALEAYDVSEDNEYLDNLTETCRHVFNVPIALVSLVYGDRQFFHSRCGLGARESPRETSFCAWTLLPENPKVLLVEDASSQEQFKDNPLVLGPPYIRFYAGAPLVEPKTGLRLGSICCIDYKPRTMEASKLLYLRRLADLVVQHLSLRKDKEFYRLRAHRVENENLLWKMAVDSFAEGLVVMEVCDGPRKARPSEGEDGSDSLALVIILANHGFLCMTGFGQDEVHNSELKRFLADDAEHYHQQLVDALLSMKSGKYQCELRTKAGETFWVELNCSPLQDTRHKRTQIFATVTNIQERKMSERRLKKSNAELALARKAAEAASKAKNVFLANIGHEIRTPVNAVVAFSGLLMESELTEEQAELMEMIVSSSEQLLRTINDVLDFGTIEADRVVLEHLPFNLFNVLDLCMNMQAMAFNSKSLELHYIVDDDVPRTIMGDSGRLQQILSNLISNAGKFTHAGSVSVQVSRAQIDAEGMPVPTPPIPSGFSRMVSPMSEVGESHILSESHRDGLFFRVVDSGSGMDTGNNIIFQPFMQGDNQRTRRIGGAGLGLAICRGLANKMRGTIWVDTAKGLGSTFSFTMELMEADSSKHLSGQEDTAHSSGGTKHDPAVPGVNSAKERILITYSSREDFYAAVKCAARHSHIECLRSSTYEELDAAIQRATELGHELILAVDKEWIPSYGDQTFVEAMQSIATGNPAVLGSIVYYMGSKVPLDRCTYVMKPVTCRSLASVLDKFRYLSGDTSDNMQASQSIRRELSREIDDTLSILVAEDNIVNQRVLQKLLGSMGRSCVTVSNGHEVIDKTLTEGARFDVILMDLQMPEMDGLEATRELRERMGETNMPCVIACTADLGPSVVHECREAGMSGYISKPITKRELEDVLTALERRILHLPSRYASIGWIGPEEAMHRHRSSQT